MTKAFRGCCWMVLLASAHPLMAQDASIEPGARVRIKVRSLSTQLIVGTIESVRDSILVLRSNPATPPTEIRFSHIERLEVSQGRKTNAARGAVIGTLIGGGVGTVVGLIGKSAGSDLPSNLAVTTGAIGAGGGLLIGTLLGAASQSDRWVRVSPEQLKVSLIFIDGRRAGLGLSLAW